MQNHTWLRRGGIVQPAIHVMVSFEFCAIVVARGFVNFQRQGLGNEAKVYGMPDQGAA